MQQKMHRPVQFELTLATRDALEAWVHEVNLRDDDYLFPKQTRRSQ